MDIEALRTSRWILLPGTLCNASVFDPFLDILQVAQSHRIELLLDKPAVEDYQEFFQNDSQPGDIVCGFSLGAIVAAHHAHRLENAAVLILFGVNPHYDDPARKVGRIALQDDVHSQGGRAALQHRLSALNGRAADVALTRILEMAEQTAGLIDAQTALALTRPGALDVLQDCRVPVYAISGERDEQASPEYASIVANAAPRGQHHLIEGLGHYALLEDPAACASAVRFLVQGP